MSKDNLFIDDSHQQFKFKKEEDSDSGDDYDYGEEGEEGEEQEGNIDLMEYISNMDIPGAE